MTIIAAATQKGGAAKTTLIICLADYVSQCGYRVLIIDADPQSSAWKWFCRRKKLPPIVIVCAPDEVMSTVKANPDYDLYFLDTPGRFDSEIERLLALPDLTLIPTSTSRLDVEESLPTARALKAHGRTFKWVMIKCPPGETRVSKTQLLLDRWGGRVGPVMGHRLVYQDAIAAGRGVIEEQRNGPAADEIRGLWRSIAEIIGLSERKH